MKFLILFFALFSTQLFSAPFILAGSGVYSEGRCQVFILSEEVTRKLWVISFPKNEGEDSPINDLVSNQENYNGMGEIVDLAAKGFEDFKGFKLFISGMGEKVSYTVKTKTLIVDLEATPTCQ